MGIPEKGLAEGPRKFPGICWTPTHSAFSTLCCVQFAYFSLHASCLSVWSSYIIQLLAVIGIRQNKNRKKFIGIGGWEHSVVYITYPSHGDLMTVSRMPSYTELSGNTCSVVSSCTRNYKFLLMLNMYCSLQLCQRQICGNSFVDAFRNNKWNNTNY